MKIKSAAITLGLVLVLLVPAAAQNGNTAWVSWAAANHHRVSTVQPFDGDTFADLQFFRTVLGDRRIVQLGESGHGVAEFNHAKVRLIKFLHQQLGYDVIAFESGLYECYAANHDVALTAINLMRNCIFGVWHTSEVVPLFEYIKSTQGTARPLTLAGFDTQISSSRGIASRPQLFADMVRIIDPARAAQVAAEDQQHIAGVSVASGATYATANEPRLTEFYGGLEQMFQQNRAALQQALPGSNLPKVAERAAFSMLRFMEQLRAGSGARPNPAETGGAIRDFGMANNLSFLADDLYRDRKIMVWAHNFHIRHDNAATSSVQPTMGQWIRERFRDQLYTIGLYMGQGTGAQNNRVVYSINPGPVNSMEWVMASTGTPILFMDFLQQSRVDGNRWMFQSTSQREWGTNLFTMVPRNQYDGVLFINVVQSPSYVTF